MRLHLIRFFTGLVLVFAASGSWAAIEIHEFNNDIDRVRYQSFIDEMRCPKCQNQSLSGSDSPIASDLRRELYIMINDGRSDKEIVDFMVERYGEFILYRPRVTSATLLLWGLPGALLLLGGLILIVIVRKRRNAATELDTGLSAAEQVRLDKLLGEQASPDGKQPSTDNRQTSTDKETKQ